MREQESSIVNPREIIFYLRINSAGRTNGAAAGDYARKLCLTSVFQLSLSHTFVQRTSQPRRSSLLRETRREREEIFHARRVSRLLFGRALRAIVIIYGKWGGGGGGGGGGGECLLPLIGPRRNEVVT